MAVPGLPSLTVDRGLRTVFVFLGKVTKTDVLNFLTTKRAGQCARLGVVLRGPHIPGCLRPAHYSFYRHVLSATARGNHIHFMGKTLRLLNTPISRRFTFIL
jgi:hypothetical protein